MNIAEQRLRRPLAQRATRSRLLLAPIPITPTKPLTPSHVKALLWLDTLYKATAVLHDVTYLCNRVTSDATVQTVGFWAYLDAFYPGSDYAEVDERWIGERYVGYHASPEHAPTSAVVRDYMARVLNDRFVHPASVRLLQIWQQHYALLALHDPGVFNTAPLALGVEQTILQIQRLGVGLDLRHLGGGMYIDLTCEGLPLRQIIAADGTPNYLFHALRELLSVEGYDHVQLLCDDELGSDYLLLERVLARANTPASRLTLGRVPIAGVVTSARHGNWQAYTVDRIFTPLLHTFGLPAMRLGARLYFVAGLGRGSGQSFRPEVLRGFVGRAAELLARCSAVPRPHRDRAFLARFERPNGCVDPYRLVSQLFAKHTSADTAAFLCSVLLS